jgi:hypothetical protein
MLRNERHWENEGEEKASQISISRKSVSLRNTVCIGSTTRHVSTR